MAIEKANIIEKTLDAYSLAFRNEQDNFERARILEKIANNYYELAFANHKNFRYNLLNAIEAYLQALQVRTLDQSPMDYAMTQNNLGAAYQTLAEVEDKAENSKRAVKAFLQALQVRTLDQSPMDYAMTQNNLGAAYQTLAEVEDKAENSRRAVEAFLQALQVSTLDLFPMDYAMTQNNLGTAYQTLAKVEDKAENSRKAIGAYLQALQVRTFDQSPVGYANTQSNLGTAYQTLAEVEDKAENSKRAVKAFLQALQVRTLDQFSVEYANTQNNLGNAYQILAEFEEKAENSRKAIEAFLQALQVRTLDEFPMDYAMTQNNLGNAYQTLAEVENKAENSRKAIEAFQRALQVRTLDQLAMDNAEAQNIPEAADQSELLSEFGNLNINSSKEKKETINRNKVFICYSHADSDWLGRLRIHLKPLEREKVIFLWSDENIKAGDKWKNEIQLALDSAKVAVLIISADFLASEFIINKELPDLLTAAKDDGAIIIPLIAKPSRFLRDPVLSQFQAINSPSDPLIGQSEMHQEEILVKLTEAIESYLK
jgi:tetratricopeptide (TPR) repeat protein